MNNLCIKAGNSKIYLAWILTFHQLAILGIITSSFVQDLTHNVGCKLKRRMQSATKIIENEMNVI